MIGVFDSGVGGLSILRHVRNGLPDHDMLYVADQAFAPYGDRSLEWVHHRSRAITDWLIGAGASIVVVACNTASAAALKALRREYPEMPFVGMEPAVKPAAETSVRGVVGVLATRATFQGELYASVVDRHALDVGVVERVGTGLVELVEAGTLDGAEAERVVRSHLEPMITADVDTVVLGCTHYAFLTPVMRTLLGPGVELIDPAPAVARQTARLVQTHDAETRDTPVVRYATTGDAGRFSEQLEALLGEVEASVTEVRIEADESSSGLAHL